MALAVAVAALVAVAPGSTATPKGPPIIIGAPVALTGFMIPWGLWPTRMAQFAVDDINKAGGVLGRPLKIISSDDKSDPAANGPSAASDVISKGASIVMTNCDFDWTAPAAGTAQSKGVPAISYCAGAPRLGPKGLGPLTFSAGISTPNEASAMAEWAHNKQKYKSAYLLVDTTIAYNTTYCAFFAKRWKQLGGTIAGEDQFKNGDPSLTSQVTRLSGLRPKPHAIMLCSYPPGGTTAIRQIRAGGVDLPLLMNVGMSGYYWLNGVPGLKNAWQDGYVGLRGDDPIAKVNQLTKRYRAKYGEPIKTPIAYAGYQTVQLIAAAIKAAGSTDGKKIAAALVKGKVQILTGPHTFDPDYNVSFTSPAVILKIENGTLKFVTRLAPSKNSKALLTK